MTFLHLGLAMAAAACVAIPIAIHLLMRRRRKPVMWGAMRFLLEAYRRQRRRLMLEQWLLLASRCLLVLLLGLAIARPLLGGLGAPAPGGRTVYLLVDNGLASTVSINTAGAVGSALSRHKSMADRILSQLVSGEGSAIGDRVALITLGGPAEAQVVPPSGDIGAVRRLVGNIAATDSRADLHGALTLAAAAIQSERERGGDGGESAARSRRTYVVVLSDFLDGSADIDAGGAGGAGTALPQLPAGVTMLALRPSAAGADNISITGVEPLRSLIVAGGGGAESAAGEQVRVTLRRSGPTVAQPGIASVRVRLSQAGGAATPAAAVTGGAGVGRGSVRFEAGQEEATGVVSVPVALGPGLLAAESRGEAGAAGGGGGVAMLVAELDADAVAGDNTWRRPVEVRQTLRVGVVSLRRFGDVARADQLTPTEWIRLALRPGLGDGGLGDGGPIEITEIEPGGLDAGRLARLDALVLPRPDLLNDDMWRRVRAFADGGGLVVVTPPAGVTVHAWADGMVRELGLGWSLPREAQRFGGNGDGAGGGGGARLASPAAASGRGEDLLALLRPELEELLRPVSVFRVLAVQPGERNGAEARVGSARPAGGGLLTLNDGSIVLWAGSPGEVSAAAAGNGSGAWAEAPADGQGRGLIVYLGTSLDLEWTDLPARPLMVPLLQELVRQGVGQARGSWWGLAGRTASAPRRSVELVRVEERARGGSAASGDAETGAPSTVRLDAAATTIEPIRHGGVWRAMDDRGNMRGIVAINADPRGGLTNPQTASDVQRWLRAAAGDEVGWLEDNGATDGAGGAAALAAALAPEDRGPPISFPLLLAAAMVALMEMGLARWASHAETGP